MKTAPEARVSVNRQNQVELIVQDASILVCENHTLASGCTLTPGKARELAMALYACAERIDPRQAA